MGVRVEGFTFRVGTEDHRILYATGCVRVLGLRAIPATP